MPNLRIGRRILLTLLAGISFGICRGSVPAVPVLFIPGYAASTPAVGTISSYVFARGALPQDLSLSLSYDFLVRSLTNAGYVRGKTFFGAVYDWRMKAAPDDGNFDGNLENVTASAITAGNFRYAVDYLGYWLDQAVQANPGVQYVDVVTHSTGGILVRAYIQSPAYGAVYVDGNGITQHLPKIRHLILGADPNEGTVHSWRPWNGDFQDVLSGFIPTTKIEGRFAALAFAYVSLGGTIAGPDHDITLFSILKRDKEGKLVPDATEFFHQYVPMRQSLMPTSNFLLTPHSRILKNVNDDPSLRSSVLLDLNALSTPGHNPWLNRIGIPAGEGGVIATFASGAREKSNFLDFIIAGQINNNSFIYTVTGIRQKSGKRGRFLPLLALLEPTPTVISVRKSQFPRVGDTELKQQLAGDGNAPFTSYLSTFSGDPKVDLVQWGNGPPPPNIPAYVVWNRQTNYPVYHDVFFYNPDVRAFVVSVITGISTAAEPVTFDDLDLISETP